MSERLPFSSGEELISRVMGGANVCTYVMGSLWSWSYHVSIQSIGRRKVWSNRSERERSCLLRRFPCPAFHWTCYHGILDCVHSFKQLANQVGYKFIARVAIELEHKQTLSSGCALGLGSFTAMNPWPRAITITYIVDNIIVLQYN